MLHVEDLLDQPHIDLSPERNAELESFGEWALAAFSGMSRIAEGQVKPHDPELPAGTSTPLPAMTT